MTIESILLTQLLKRRIGSLECCLIKFSKLCTLRLHTAVLLIPLEFNQFKAQLVAMVFFVLWNPVQTTMITKYQHGVEVEEVDEETRKSRITLE